MATTIPICPREGCGGQPAGTRETIPGCALITFDDEGNAEYEGTTKVYWDGQTSDTIDGRLILICDKCAHYFVAPADFKIGR